MTPALLFPLGLAALAAAILPLAIHLARRTEQRPTDFAALRWLRHRPRPRHRPTFDERRLLAARLLLIALLALMLARPVLFDSADTRSVIAVVPGLTVPQDDRARRVWLAPGFPATDTPAPAGPIPIPIGSLIRELDSTLAPGTALTLVVPATLSGADAERPRVSRRVTWRVMPGAMLPAPAGPPPGFALRVAADHAAPARYIRAAAAALAIARFDSGAPTRPIARDTRALVWLAGGALPAAIVAWVSAGGTLLVAHDTRIDAAPMGPAWTDASGVVLVETRAQRRGRILRFTRALTPAAIPELADATFPQRLATVLAGDAPAPSRVVADAYRPAPGGLPPARPSRDPAPWLAIAVTLAFALERWLATRARRAVAP